MARDYIKVRRAFRLSYLFLLLVKLLPLSLTDTNNRLLLSLSVERGCCISTASFLEKKMASDNHTRRFFSISPAEIALSFPEHLKKDAVERLAYIAIPMSVMLQYNKISFVEMKNLVTIRSQENVKRLRDNFWRTYKQAWIGSPLRQLNWEKLCRRLKGANTQKINQRNTDVRVWFRWEKCFLVKYCFTFGQQTVVKDTWHVIHTTSTPMLFFVPKPTYVPRVEANYYLNPEEGRLHKKYVLRPHQRYVIPPGTMYLLVAVNKTLFSFHVVDSAPDGRSPTEDTTAYEAPDQEWMIGGGEEAGEEEEDDDDEEKEEDDEEVTRKKSLREEPSTSKKRAESNAFWMVGEEKINKNKKEEQDGETAMDFSVIAPSSSPSLWSPMPRPEPPPSLLVHSCPYIQLKKPITESPLSESVQNNKGNEKLIDLSTERYGQPLDLTARNEQLMELSTARHEPPLEMSTAGLELPLEMSTAGLELPLELSTAEKHYFSFEYIRENANDPFEYSELDEFFGRNVTEGLEIVIHELEM